MKNLALLIILLSFLGCTKFGKNITVKGRVLNPITGQGIEGAELNLLRGTLELPGGEKSVKKVFTDANGNYEISKFSLSGLSLSVGNLGDRYAIGWHQDGQITVKNNNNLSVKKRKTMHADFHAVEYGLLNFDIQNVNCEGPNDVMQFRKKYQFSDEFEGYSTERFGCYSYVSSSPGQLPVGTYIYEIKVTRSNGTTFIYDTVYVDQSGNSTIQLYY